MKLTPASFLLASVSVLLGSAAAAADKPAGAPIPFRGGSASDFQALLDQAPAGAVIACEQDKPIDVAASIVLRKPVTLRDFKARLLPKVDNTPILIAESEEVTLTGLELRGNYDTVDQDRRAPLIHIKRGRFQIEHCKFYDGSKDGIMVTPDDGTGDIVGGTIRDIEGSRMARDLVSIGGGNGGQRIRDVTVENVRLKKGFLRGAVEVSDGTDHITVRHVYAEDAVYGIDVQDHGPVSKTTGKASAPNTRVVIEDVTAVRCQHIIRTKNHPLGHAGLTLRDFAGRDCAEPVRVSNTANLLIENLTITNEKPLGHPPVELRNNQQVVLRNATITVPLGDVRPVAVIGCTEVQFDRVTANGARVEQPAKGKGKQTEKPEPKPNDASGKPVGSTR